jgi:mono/diheme cytochrome c family protein
LKPAAAGALFAALQLLAGCAGKQRGASPANMGKAQLAVPNGSALFQANCASCHGDRGQSVGRPPRIMGPGALPELPSEQNINADPAAGDPELLRFRARARPAGAPWRDPFRTAEDVFRFVSTNMPQPAEKAGSLRPEEYWAIVNFMLVAHGVDVPPSGITEQNASSVKLHPAGP